MTWKNVVAYRSNDVTVTLERWDESPSYRMIVDDVNTGEYAVTQMNHPSTQSAMISVVKECNDIAGGGP